MPRIEIELTSARPDGTWTWRAAGARQPKGTLEGALLTPDVKVGDVLRADTEQRMDGIRVTAVLPPKAKRAEPERLALLGPPEREAPPRPGEDGPPHEVRRGGPPRDDRRSGPRSRGPRDRGARPGGREREPRPGGRERGPRTGSHERPPRDPGARGPSGPARAGDRGPSGPARAGDRGPSGPARAGDRGPSGPARAGDRGPSGPTRAGDRGPSGPRSPSDRSRSSPRSAPDRQTPPRPRAKRLHPGRAHREAVLGELSAEQRPVAEQVLRGGIPAVRQAVDEHNANARASGQPEIKADPFLAMAEELLPRLRAAEWRDRAEAAMADVETVTLRDLRAIVTGSDAAGRDDAARMLVSDLRQAVDRRSAAEREKWLDEVRRSLADGRVVRALRVSGRPPEPGQRFPADLGEQLSAAASAAMTPQVAPDRWAAVLDAVVSSPVRLSVRPEGLPTDPGEALTAAVRRATGRVPALRALVGGSPPARGAAPGSRPPPPPAPPARPAPAPTAKASTAKAPPAPPEPAATETAVTEPAATEPAATTPQPEPAGTPQPEPTATTAEPEPAAPEPAATTAEPKPAVTEPTATEPDTTEPAATEPEPTAAEPAATEPAATEREPAIPEPAAAEPELAEIEARSGDDRDDPVLVQELGQAVDES